MAAETIQRMYKYTTKPLHKSAKTVFFHNAIHDMESIFWVTFCLMLNVESQDQDSREDIIDLLFTGWDTAAAERWTFVSFTSKAEDHYYTLLGEDRTDLLEELLALKTILTGYYKESEAKIPHEPIDISKFPGIHKEFRDVWTRCQTFLLDHGVPLKPELFRKKATGVKREAEAELKPLRRSKRTRTCVFTFFITQSLLN